MNALRTKGMSKPLMLLPLAFVAGWLCASFFKPAWFSRKPLNKPPIPKPVARPQPHKAAPAPKFEFYTLLGEEKKTQVSRVEPILKTPAVPVLKPNTPDTWLLQLASFKNKADAEHMRAAMIMKGFDAAIDPVTQQNMTWYRVVIGPFATRLQAEKAQISIADTERIKGMIRSMSS